MLNKSNIIFIFFIIILIIGTVLYNLNFSKVKVDLDYKISLLPENYNSDIYLRNKNSVHKITFNKVYDLSKKKRNIEFENVVIGENTIILKTTKEFNKKNQNGIEEFKKKYDEYIDFLILEIEKEYMLSVISDFEDEYNYMLLFHKELDNLNNSTNLNKTIEKKISKIFLYYIEYSNIFNSNRVDLFNNFHKNVILFNNSDNLEDYVKLKNIKVLFTNESKVKKIVKLIEYIDLLIVIISISIVYFSIYFFTKKNLK